MSLIDPISAIALILGIIFTIRRLDVARRVPADHPGVPEAAFRTWQPLQLSAYRWLSVGPLAFVAFDLAFKLLIIAARGSMPLLVVQVGGGLSYAMLIACLFTGGRQARTARLMRREAGIDLSRAPGAPS